MVLSAKVTPLQSTKSCHRQRPPNPHLSSTPTSPWGARPKRARWVTDQPLPKGREGRTLRNGLEGLGRGLKSRISLTRGWDSCLGFPPLGAAAEAKHNPPGEGALRHPVFSRQSTKSGSVSPARGGLPSTWPARLGTAGTFRWPRARERSSRGGTQGRRQRAAGPDREGGGAGGKEGGRRRGSYRGGRSLCGSCLSRGCSCYRPPGRRRTCPACGWRRAPRHSRWAAGREAERAAGRALRPGPPGPPLPQEDRRGGQRSETSGTFATMFNNLTFSRHANPSQVGELAGRAVAGRDHELPLTVHGGAVQVARLAGDVDVVV